MLHAGHPELREHVGEHPHHAAADAVDRGQPGRRSTSRSWRSSVTSSASRRRPCSGSGLRSTSRSSTRRAAERGAARQPRHEPHTGCGRALPAVLPVSRYVSAAGTRRRRPTAGTSARTSSGADPVDRQNMDSFSLFTAGGMDFLLLSLEYNAARRRARLGAPGAGRLPGAPGDRRDAQLRRHPGGLTTQVGRERRRQQRRRIWDELVAPAARLHRRQRPLPRRRHGRGAPHRHQLLRAAGAAILSDYQDRGRGGDGWLRYYTFDPGADEIRAVTYSPFLGQFETDADSAFSLPYDMKAPAGPRPSARHR